MNRPIRRKLAVGLSATALGVGVLAPAGSLLAPASAADAARAEANAVTSGDARFEVLSPTLIRMEYAGDGAFDDDATFNAIGRDSFAPVSFTHEIAGGWLTIDTGEATLRYKVGSGMFTPSNVSLQLKVGDQTVTAHPVASTATVGCEVGALCEAETTTLTGLSPATNHTGFTGTGFVAGYETVGNALSFTTTVDEDGTYDLAMRYANSQGGDAQTTTRTLSIVVDGQAPTTISLPHGQSWNDWLTASASLELTAGTHKITVERQASNSGQVNVDSLAIVPSGAAYPAPVDTSAPKDCAFGSVCEAEDAARAGTAAVASDHNGYSGSGFAAGLWTKSAALTAHITGVPADGDYDLQVRYANGLTTSPTLTLGVGDGATSGTLPPTSGWDYWNTTSVPVHLSAGTNDVAIGCPTEASNCNVNIDTIAAVPSGTAPLAVHAALGGYRRDLDTANGSVRTFPGLLFQDGWSLLDDTASALYDTATETVTQRGDHGGEGYFDGYVFAYGHDYTTALRDLATLTGPTKLLPRWAYGVWYSEYYDRSQALFSSIAQQFADHDVPVDVMAIDTDYKAGSKWNGWEVDTARIQDLQALLSEWHAEGIHNTLNIHPTISATDPKFAAAQATANGKLTQSGSNYLFDWSDPDQLQAYFDLHDSIQQDGVDNWWLDWCCSENSKYSENGVTPDSFINQQYANYTNDALDGRGFAFSRAYGSLTAGGYGNPQPVATGPWADKRTTLHFTGDTTSTWDMLKAEVGYTPGESAATGTAAISHDIGGHNGAQYGIAGAETGTTQLPPELYARWVQMGAFQPIDRLHSNHSDRLPWQYPGAANESASKFLNLREDLLPLTYTLAAQATATGTPIVRPLYLQYPDSPEAYSLAGNEYLYGPDVLVAPVTTANDTNTGTAKTSVWFPEGSSWTDWFTGRTYAGGTTADVTTDLDSMPVFIRSGGIVTTRSHDVANDDKGPLDAATVTVASGSNGTGSLYEDDGTTTADGIKSATTALDYTEGAGQASLAIGAVKGSFTGQVTNRAWTVEFTNAAQPIAVSVDGVKQPASAWTYDATTRTVTVTVATRPVSQATTVSYRTAEANHAPTATDVTAATVVGHPVAITLTGTDTDGDQLTYSHGPAAHGTITGDGAALRYTASPTFIGTDSFTYTVADPYGVAVTRTVTVTVGRQQPTLKVTKKKHHGTVKLKVRAVLVGGVSAGHAGVTVKVGGHKVAHGKLKNGTVTLTLSKHAKGKAVVTLKQGAVTTAAQKKVRL
jgi:alpha-glucosidase (family GH31 glycosyl hydrolase)